MKKNILILAILISSISGYSQGYNFFTGDGNSLCTTAPKVFGSGLLDFSGTYTLFKMPYYRLSNRSVIVVAPSLRIAKYRFSDNLLLENQNGKASFILDTVSTHNYNSSFFSYQGSKLVTGWWHIPIQFIFSIGEKDEKSGIFIAPFYDRYAFAYFKRKYEVNDEIKKEKISNKDFKKYPVNKDKFGLDIGYITNDEFIFHVRYLYTPFFKQGKGPELYEMTMGIGVPTDKLYQWFVKN